MAISNVFTSGQVLTAAELNELPVGVIDEEKITTNTSLTSVQATVATITFTDVVDHQYMVVAQAFTDTVSTAMYVRGIINVDASRIQEVNVSADSTNDRVTLTPIATFLGTGASRTVEFEAATNTGTATLLGGGGRPATLIVIDMGLTP